MIFKGITWKATKKFRTTEQWYDSSRDLSFCEELPDIKTIRQNLRYSTNYPHIGEKK